MKSYSSSSNLQRASCRQSNPNALSAASVPATLPAVAQVSPEPYLPISSFTQKPSIENWIEHTSNTTHTPSESKWPQTSPQQSLKRKRSTSIQQPESEGLKPLGVLLTRKLLKQHLASMASSTSPTSRGYGLSNPVTPHRSDYGTQTTVDETPPSLASIESKMTSAQLRNSPRAVELLMRNYRIFKNYGHLKKYPTFETLVNEVADQERPSGVKPGSAHAFKEDIDYGHDQNEVTLMLNLLPLIMKDARSVKPDIYKDEQDYEVRAFRAEGVWKAGDRQFRAGHLPNTIVNAGTEDKIAKALEKSDGMTNPKPDFTYGFKSNQYQPPLDTRVRRSTHHLLEVTPGMYAPFFLIEAKSGEGFMSQAENQASRAGAAIVNATRKLLDEIGIADTFGADERTFVYSATINDGVMEFWVHWAEVLAYPDGKKAFFHMDHIESQSLRQRGALTVLRRICHNIMDWGTLTRRQMLQERFRLLWVRELNVENDEKQRAREKARAEALAQQEAGSPPRKGKQGRSSRGGTPRGGSYRGGSSRDRG